MREQIGTIFIPIIVDYASLIKPPSNIPEKEYYERLERYSKIMVPNRYFSKLSSYLQKPGNQIFNDVDPYGEENWED